MSNSTFPSLSSLAATLSDLPVIQRVPAEILVHIFIFTLPIAHEYSDTTDSKIILTDPSLVPIVITSVCRMWRVTACNTPELWDTCWLSYTHPELNHIWLSRSGIRLLTLYGQCSSCILSTRAIKHANAFMESILPFRARWKVVRVNTRPFHAPIRRSISTTRLQSYTKAEALEWVEIGGDGGTAEAHPLSFALFGAFTSAAPFVHTLKLFNVMIPILTHTMFPSLVHLQLRDTTLHFALENLRNLSRLKIFSLTTEYDIIDDSDTLPNVIHENLEHLSLSCANPKNDMDIFNHLTLPALKTLHLDNIEDHGTRGLFDMLDRSDSHITTLKISSSDLSPGALDFILRSESMHPWIESLILHNIEIHSDFLSALRYEDGLPCLPYLEHLSFKGCDFTGLPDGLLAVALDSRCGSFVFSYYDESLGWVERKVQLRSFFADSLPGALFASDIPRIVPLVPEGLADGPEAWFGQISWSQEGGGFRTAKFALGEAKSAELPDDDR